MFPLSNQGLNIAANSPSLVCPFRYDVRVVDQKEVASCGLLEQIIGRRDGDLCQVHRRACEVCCASFPSNPARMSPVFPSLIYSICERLIREGSQPIDNRYVQLFEWAERHLVSPAVGFPTVYSCDVVVCCQDSNDETRRAIESVANQRDANVVVHLANDGGGAKAIVEEYADRPGFQVYHSERRIGPYATLQRIVTSLRTEYVLLQDPCTVSRSNRVSYSLSTLDAEGAEILGSALETPHGQIRSREPRETYGRYLTPQTLVFRRSSLVDLGGFCDRHDADAELIYRAARERRKISIVDEALVEQHHAWSPPEPTLRLPKADANRRQSSGQGFPMTSVACDVVLPFHDHVDYLREALESVLQQSHVDLVIHLVDDASCEDHSKLLAYWSTHPQVRTYRNLENIGPFSTFNNLFPYFETDLIAVQDADDISLPNRLHVSGNHLRLADADIFGACTESFGDDQIVVPTDRAGGQRTYYPRPRLRRSVYPSIGVRYFLENPTAVMRRMAFGELGGFADLGSLHRNRTAVDTEFYARSYYSGRRFGISRNVLLKYRCHADSATQNPLSGWGSSARAEAVTERDRRLRIFRQGLFDARVFGALGRHQGLTKRL